MNFFQSLILGIVQGLTEFLPISSTAHLRIVPSLFHWEDPGTEYSAIIQLGTLLSILIFFYKDNLKIYGALVNEIIKERKIVSPDAKLGFWILIGTIPICVVGLIFKDPLENGVFRELNLISFYLIYFGIILYISELAAKKNKSISNITLIDVVLIGIMQAFALVPGASRSGVTILAGLLLGFKRSEAAKFSFLLSMPAIFLSGMLELYSFIVSIKSQTHDVACMNLIIGLVSAFLSGYWSIGFLLKYLQTHRTYVFVIYRIILALIVIYLNVNGMID